MFRVGQKVVWVGFEKKRAPRIDVDPPRLDRGAIYTIRDVDYRAVAFLAHEGLPTILLEEVSAPRWLSTVGIWEGGYDPRGFRPLIERKTDISIFREILRKASKPSPVKTFENSSWFGG
jgi:hypothetical protein